MKEPFVPKSTISEMLPLSLRREFFRRINGQHRLAPVPTNPFGWSDKEWDGIVDGKWPAHVPAARGILWRPTPK